MTFDQEQAAQGSFRRVDREADPAIFKAVGEGAPPPQPIVDSLGDGGMLGELGDLSLRAQAQPRRLRHRRLWRPSWQSFARRTRS